PECREQVFLPVSFHDPAAVFGLIRLPDAQFVRLAYISEILFPHPAVRRWAAGIGRDIFRDRWQPTKLQWVRMHDPVRPRGKRSQVARAGRQRALKLLERQALDLRFLVVLAALSHVAMDDARRVRQWILADASIPGVVVPDQSG